MTTIKEALTIDALSPEQQDEVLRKAQILDELVELREMATDGEWEFIFGPDIVKESHLSFIQKKHSLGSGGVICRISNTASKRELTDEDKGNGFAITEIMNRLEQER